MINKENLDGMLDCLYENDKLNNLDQSDINELTRLLILEEKNIPSFNVIEPDMLLITARWMEYEGVYSAHEIMENLKSKLVEFYQPFLNEKIENYKKYRRELSEINRRDREQDNICFDMNRM